MLGGVSTIYLCRRGFLFLFLQKVAPVCGVLFSKEGRKQETAINNCFEFALSLESTIQAGYDTEKYWAMFAYSTPTVYFGAPPIDQPPRPYIYAHATASKLATHLLGMSDAVWTRYATTPQTHRRSEPRTAVQARFLKPKLSLQCNKMDVLERGGRIGL